MKKEKWHGAICIRSKPLRYALDVFRIRFQSSFTIVWVTLRIHLWLVLQGSHFVCLKTIPEELLALRAR